MKRHTKMKDTGIDWIGKIPEHWELRRLKFSSNIELSSVDRHVNENEKQVLICHYPHVYNNEKITKTTRFDTGTCTVTELEKFWLKEDDVLITKDSETPDDIGVPAYVTENMEGTVCGYHLAQITSIKRLLLGSFLFRFLQTYLSNAYFEINSNGVTRFGLGKDSIGSLIIIQPPIEEQEKITEFLDKETTKIDSQIVSNQKLIELLNEKRQVMINQTVTKGLNPEIATKNSEIDWIGLIPEKWKTAKLKNHALKIGSGITPKGGSEIYIDKGIPFIREQNVHFDGMHLDDVVYIPPQIHEEMRSTKVKKRDVLLNITGASLGRCTVVPDNLGEANVNQHVSIIRVKTSLDSKFLCFYLATTMIQTFLYAIQVGASRQGLTFEDIGSLNILVPPIEEQNAISSYLECALSNVDQIINKATIQIQKLEEYRQSLISSAVTGIIDLKEGIIV